MSIRGGVVPSMIKNADDDYIEYKRLIKNIKYFEKRLSEGRNVNRASYEYYINLDKAKQLKKILIARYGKI